MLRRDNASAVGIQYLISPLSSHLKGIGSEMKPMRFKRKRPYGSANSDRGTDYSDRNKTILNRKRRRFEQKRDRKANTQSVESVIAKYETFMKRIFYKQIGKFQEDVSKFEKFDDFPLSTQTQNGLSEADFVKPTEIQRDSLQYSLTGVDVVGAAKTGSGKTLALLIPVG
ncbi:unnamed protein product [Anisakis simplex]|uniref:ATP-dependent RNA helicase n=1 Tax=Anisakis simplex TaxID=6269 RepID=A0A0M3J5E1_ANISI|nr:unnamed protein product [Anisakis simplex]